MSDNLDDLFEEAAAACGAENDASWNDPVNVAKRKAQMEREIAQGLRDQEGHWIMPDDDNYENEEDDEEE
jgi:hypothetical protein